MSATPDLLTVLAIGDLPLESIQSIRWESRANRPAEARVVVRAPLDLPLDALLGAPALVGFGLETLDARHMGVVVEVTVQETEVDRQGGLRLEIVVASAMWLLGESHDSKVFLDKDLVAIVTEVCEAHGLAAASLDFRLTEQHDTWPMTNQYDETALAFVSRLCEAEGVAWFSEATDDGEKIVFMDRTSAADAVPGDGLRVLATEGMTAALEVISDVRRTTKTVTGKVSLRDYDFTRPKLDIAGDAEAADDADLEQYDFAEHVEEPDRAKFRAQMRLDAIQAGKQTIEIVGRSVPIVTGKIVKISGAPAGIDGEYFVVGIDQRLERDNGVSLVTRASLVPKDVPWRPQLTTPRPTVSGLETAIVVAPKGSDVETVHTDEHARVKVKLPWDRSERVDDDTSHWARVMQLQTYDSLILPRIGWEVVLDYVEGDPDRPIVLGRVYNGVSMPPYALPEGKTRTSLQSASSPGGGGRNEIRMEDKAGSEEVSITAEKDQSIDIAGDKTLSVVADQKRDVGSNSTTTISGDQEIQVSSGYENGAASQVMTVGGSRNFTVAAVLGWASGGASVTTVGGSQNEMIGNPLKGLLSLAGQVAIEKIEAEAKEAMANLEGAVASKVDQVMGPVNDLQSKASDVGKALGGSDPSGGLGALGGMPSAGDFAKGMLSKGGSAMEEAVTGAIDAKGRGALEALGLDPGEADGASEANKAGVDGAAGGNSASNSACGPGHSITKVTASSAETVGGTKLVLSAGKVVTNVTAGRTTNVGAVQIDLALGSRVETCSASKKESSVGFVSVVGGDEVEEVGGARTIKVGGAIAEKISGGATVSAGGILAMAGAYWKIDASGSIVLSCGAAKVTIGGGGIEIAAPAITITAPKIEMPATVAED